jgi:hypothetical protein
MRSVSSQLTSRQLGALALTAAGLPIFRLCCRVSWPWALLGGLAAAGTLSLLTTLQNRRRIRREGSSPRSGTSLTIARRAIFAPIPLLGALLAAWETTYSFPETAENLPAAALVLFLSAAALRGSAAAGRCAAVLLWVTGALYGTVLFFSLPELRADWLVPTGSPIDALRVWGALLSPGAVLCLGAGSPPAQRLPHWPWWTAAGLAAAASAVTGGILSPALAREPEAFRTLARGVSVLGVIRRFEALVNGALLMSGFALCTLYLVVFENVSCIYRGFEKSKKKFEKTQKKC